MRFRKVNVEDIAKDLVNMGFQVTYDNGGIREVLTKDGKEVNDADKAVIREKAAPLKQEVEE